VSTEDLPIGLCVQAACLLEVTARKPGNVHRLRDFDDAGLIDFLLSAAAIGPVLDGASGRRVGETVLQAVRATRRVAPSNTNLGIILLLAPLAAVPPGEDLRAGVEWVLTQLDCEDARLVYKAIRDANPGGLGQAPAQDVKEEPTQSLREVMALAAGRDLVARQYADGFREIFDAGVPILRHFMATYAWLEYAIVGCHLHLMAHYPDTLIARKRCRAEAEDAAARARRVRDAGWPITAEGVAELAKLDAWLRAEGRGRNPGTTADLVTACLFVALRERIIQLPQGFAPPHTGDESSHD
jgi:triphosphoribosyl-dephospho-CoA synthase